MIQLNFKKKSVFNRQYEDIHVGDTVRTSIKKTSFSKGSEPRFSETTYKVTDIKTNPNGDEEYILNGKKKPYIRHELRLVKSVQDSKTFD